MTAQMVALTTTYEVYTTSTLVSARVKVPAGLSAATLTNLIVEAQNDIDRVLFNSFPWAGTSTLFAAGSVPPDIQNIALQFAIAKVIDTSLRQGFGVAGGTDKRDGFLKAGMERLEAIEAGEGLQDGTGGVVARVYSKERFYIVASATPADGMTITDTARDFFGFEVELEVTATSSGSSTAGLVKIQGLLDKRESITEHIQVNGAGNYSSKYQWYRIQRVDASGVTGGTAPKVALAAVKARGRQYVGGRA
jgi:hypothetical protein